jgi:hypothetical protein
VIDHARWHHCDIVAVIAIKFCRRIRRPTFERSIARICPPAPTICASWMECKPIPAQSSIITALSGSMARKRFDMLLHVFAIVSNGPRERLVTRESTASCQPRVRHTWARRFVSAHPTDSDDPRDATVAGRFRKAPRLGSVLDCLFLARR